MAGDDRWNVGVGKMAEKMAEKRALQRLMARFFPDLFGEEPEPFCYRCRSAGAGATCTACRKVNGIVQDEPVDIRETGPTTAGGYGGSTGAVIIEIGIDPVKAAFNSLYRDAHEGACEDGEVHVLESRGYVPHEGDKKYRNVECIRCGNWWPLALEKTE